MSEKVLAAVAQLAPIAKSLDISMSALSLAWVLSNPGVSSAIMGASKPSQVKENVKASGIKLPEQVIKQINTILAPVSETSPEKTLSPNPRA